MAPLAVILNYFEGHFSHIN